jgi:arylsulfatase A-like enzyme
VNAGLAPRFGEGAWVRHFSAQAVQFDPKLLAEKKPDLAALAAETKALLAREPGFAAAYTRAEILGTAPADAPYLALVRKAFHADLSGDVQAVLRPHWMFASSSSAATHGSPHPYDTHVPIAFYGPAWVKAGRRDGRVDVSDIAPTISRLLAIPAPAASEGRPLPLAP